VTSSTSNSESPNGLLARALAFLLVWIAISQAFRPWSGNFPHHVPTTREGDTFYLSGDGNIYDYTGFMQDASRLEAARRGSLLLAGNSRVQFGVDRDTVQEAIAGTSAKPFWLGLPYEGRAGDTLTMIERGDLRPKLLVMHVDWITFDRDHSPFVDTMLAKSPARVLWDTASIKLRNRLWRGFLSLVPVRQHWFRHGEYRYIRQAWLYRSVREGDWVPAKSYVLGRSAPIGRPTEDAPRDSYAHLERAARFVTALRARGCDVAFISIPNDKSNEVLARRMAQKLGISFIEPDWRHMKSFDQSHLDRASARAFTLKMMRDLKTTPEWERAFGKAQR